MKKLTVILAVVCFPLVACAQVYQAAQPVAPQQSGLARWEVSVGGNFLYNRLQDPTGEKILSGEKGFFARGFYYVTPWFAAGLEGTWFGREHLTPGNVYHHRRYGLITKWIITPQTNPQVYATLGAGTDRRKISYASLWNSHSHADYVVLGAGVQAQLSGWMWVGLELQAVHNDRRRIDNFSLLKSAWEKSLLFYGSVRF